MSDLLRKLIVKEFRRRMAAAGVGAGIFYLKNRRNRHRYFAESSPTKRCNSKLEFSDLTSLTVMEHCIHF